MDDDGYDFEAAAAMEEEEELERRGAPRLEPAHSSSGPVLVPGRAPPIDDDGHDFEAAAAMEELERRGAPRLEEPAPTLRPPAQPAEGACVDCGQEAQQAKFLAAFGLHVCYDCQKRFKVRAHPLDDSDSCATLTHDGSVARACAHRPRAASTSS